jgi:hypothetical protein
VRKSTNDLFATDNDTRFKTMYAQAFKDHTGKTNGSNSASMMSPVANKNIYPVASKITTPVRASLNTIDIRKPPLGAQASPDPKLRYFIFDLISIRASTQIQPSTSHKGKESKSIFH